MTWVALFLLVSLVDLLLLSRATSWVSRIAVLPLGATQRIEVDEKLAQTLLTEPGAAGYREAPEQIIDVSRFAWPKDQQTPEGTVTFDRENARAVIRTKWSGKRIPAVGRVEVRGTRGAVELVGKFAPSPLSLVLLVTALGAWFTTRANLEALLICVAIAGFHLLSTYAALSKQRDRAQTRFAMHLEELAADLAQDEAKRRIEVPAASARDAAAEVEALAEDEHDDVSPDVVETHRVS